METPSKNRIPPIAIIGALFFIFGFVTWLNGTLIPYLKISCQLNNFESQLVAFAFYISYFVTALPSSWLLKKTGFKTGMMLGLLVMAAGCLLFIPASESRTYGLFLTGLFVIGSGLSILQTAANPYVTIVGPIESAARRISIMGICNKVAGTLAPVFLGMMVLSGADQIEATLATLQGDEKIRFLNELSARVQLPYYIMAAVLAGLALMIRFSPLPEVGGDDEAAIGKDSGKTSVFQFPNLILGVIALFLYVGAEVIAADTIANYGKHLGVPLSDAKFFPSLTLSAMVVGYILGIIFIPKFISQSRALAISAVTGMIFAAAVLMTSGYISIMFLALLGLANALMWPAIWPLAIDGLGKFVKTGSALLIMAIAGGATLPLAYGLLADMKSFGPQEAYIVLIPCYAFILYFSVSGYKIRKWASHN